MKRYEVKVKEVKYLSTIVWADNEEDAEEKASSVSVTDYDTFDCNSETLSVEEIKG